jgi:hypothetical protein
MSEYLERMAENDIEEWLEFTGGDHKTSKCPMFCGCFVAYDP